MIPMGSWKKQSINISNEGVEQWEYTCINGMAMNF